ncbi:filamentous hemagglutinin N-terminal domain-containing protein [Pseudovibrio exalbescens]|uniref:two-partner secretion domain-containing protein n=1 Tax=Pseudovibrio exalbescens TaxID=197461 RepID=UPI0023672581|nr:filamentous hemagglutinin N-terminal domain-containing protein [Pseudovibrio exalbescens]MDD7912018.1 filamentous hemagglutinin N-terminal domain-containing protein [Pseudovibrio exalbescens]
MLKFFERSLALLLSTLLTVQPVLVQASEVRVSIPNSGPRAQVKNAPNGVPVVNISTPNGKGVSHDRFTRFEVDDVILNNSATITGTRLSGWIEGNPNLTAGKEARSWIGEVVGGQQAQLNGLLEVAGQKMDVILANEFGITCNGCGFINTGRATLTTGVPVFDQNGHLAGFDVRQGKVTIGAEGFNLDPRLSMEDLTRVDVISRAAAVYGAMHAKELNVITGANAVSYDWSFDPQTNEVQGVTPQAGTSEVPELAVDVAALGGMYANSIKLLATENGVGVHLDGEMASATNIALSANGQITLGKPTETRRPLIKAGEKVSLRSAGPIVLEGSLLSESNDSIDVVSAGGTLVVAGEVSGGAVTLESAGIAAISGVVHASQRLALNSTGSALEISESAVVAASEVDGQAAGELILSGKVTAEGEASFEAGKGLELGSSATLKAQAIRLQGGTVATSGQTEASDTLAIKAGAGGMINQGSLHGREVALDSAQGVLNAGKINASETARVEAAGLFESEDLSEFFANQADIKAGAADLAGTIKANDSLYLTTTHGDLTTRGVLVGSAITLEAAEDLSLFGAVSAELAADLEAADEIVSSLSSQLIAEQVTFEGNKLVLAGSVLAGDQLEIVAGAGGLSNIGDLVGAQTTLSSQGGIDVSGSVTADDLLTIAAGTVLSSTAEAEFYGERAHYSGKQIALGGVAIIGSDLTVIGGADGLDVTGELSSRTITINAAADLSISGLLDADEYLALDARTGELKTAESATLYAETIDVAAATILSAGELLAQQDVEISALAGAFNNTALVGGKTVALRSASDLLHSGKIVAVESALVHASGKLEVKDGAEVSAKTVSMQGDSAKVLGNVLAENQLLLMTTSGALELGGFASASEATIEASGALTTHGLLELGTGSTLVSKTGNILLGGVVEARDLHVTSAQDLMVTGLVEVEDEVRLVSSQSFGTSSGAGLYADDLVITAADVITKGDIRALHGTSITAANGSIENDGLVGGATTTLGASSGIVNSGVLAGTTKLTATAGQSVTSLENSQVSGDDISVESRRVALSGTTVATGSLEVKAGTGGLVNAGALVAEEALLTSATTLANTGSITGRERVSLSMADAFTLGTDFAVYGKKIEIEASAITADGVIAAAEELKLSAGTGGLTNTGTLSSQRVFLNSQSFLNNAGTISAGEQLTITASDTVTNVAALISGDDLAVYSQELINNGGVVWANDSITIAANDNLDRSALLQNTNGRIEAFQGNLTIRADEVHNVGTAPTLSSSQIIRWLEKGRSGPVNSADEILKLIDTAYLDGSGKVLPAYTANYLALWQDLLSGSEFLSEDARAIVKTSVLKPSQTQLTDGLQRLWDNMYSKANAAGTPDPIQAMADLLDPVVFDADGNMLPEFEQAYLELWETLASGSSTVSSRVRGILGKNALVFEEVTDPVSGEVTRVYSNELDPEVTSLWTAMSAGAAKSYDILKILYQDRFNDDGVLAELVAGQDVSIETEVLKNIFGNISAGNDLMLTANKIENKAVGATQVLLEVHKKPDCFTCHEGEVAYYDTFGGRIEAVGKVSISGELVNLTINTSEMSMQDMIDTMNAFIEEQKAAGDPDMTGIPNVRTRTLDFKDVRTPDHIAPVEGDGTDIRTVDSVDVADEVEVDTGPGTPEVTVRDVESEDRVVAEPGIDPTTITATDVTTLPTKTVNPGKGKPIIIPVEVKDIVPTVETVVPVEPVLTPTTSVEELLSTGLTALAETDPEFTDYANFITSNYMMDVDRLQYRDDLINNHVEPRADRFKAATVDPQVGPLDHLNKPVSVPKPDGSGMHTVYPENTAFELDGRGALISGGEVAIMGTSVSNAGTITAKEDLKVIAAVVSSTEGALTADEGKLSVNSLTSLLLNETTLSGKSIDILSGHDFLGRGITLDAEEDLSIFATSSVTLTGLEKNFTIEQRQTLPSLLEDTPPRTVVTSTRTVKDQRLSSMAAGGDISIVSNGDLFVAGTDVDAGGDVKLTAEKDLVLGAVESGSTTKAKNAKSEHLVSTATDIEAQGNLTATAGGSAVLMGTQVDVGGKVEIGAADDLVLAAVQDIYTSYSKTKKSGFLRSKETVRSETRVTNSGVSIAGREDVTLQADKGDLTTAGSALASAQGDINLNAAEGDIFAGAYTDVHETYSKTSKSMFGGLFGSTKIISSVDKVSRGTEALASVDLTLVSGADTTLVGAQLSAGQDLNINTGGDLDIQAAINSHRKEVFSHETGLVLMTTITENSYVEAAVLTQLLAGHALNLDVDGDARLTLYEIAGVDAQNPGDLYPSELLELEGLELLTQQLANEYFYDKQVALSPAFKALVSIAVGSVLVPHLGIANLLNLSSSWAVTAAEAFTSTFLVESLDGAVSGDFDLGDILKDATFSAVTAGLAEGVSLNMFGITSQTHPELFDGLLGTFGNNKLSIGNILEGALDGVITNGLSSAVYGTDFMEGFSASMIKTLVSLTLADIQFEIGELGIIRDANGDVIKTNEAWEGSLPHAILHGLAGCAAGAAQNGGQGCAAAAAAAVAQSLFAGTLDENLTGEQRADAVRNAEMIGALAGYIFSGGNPANVSAASAIAASGLQNNYLSHDQIGQLQQRLSECAALGAGFSACRAEVFAEYVEISTAQNAELEACETDACRAGHWARIAVAEGAFDSIVFNLMTSGEYKGRLLNDLQDSAEDLVVWTPDQATEFRAALREETTATFCSGGVNSCDISVRAELERSGALTASEQQTLNDDRLAIYLELEQQARAEIAEDVCSSSMSQSACSLAVDEEIDRQRVLDNRIAGAIDVVFGAAEVAGAVYMCPASAGTACATASVLVAAHGADTAGAGFAQLITGEEALPFGVQLVMRATGLDQTQASLAYDLMAIGFELNAVRSIASQGSEALIKQHDQVFNGGIVNNVPNRTLTRDELIAGLPEGTRITTENVVDIQQLPNGQTVWLETGSSSAGLQHINRHAGEFAQKGISQDEIPDAVFAALQQNNVVGYQGTGTGRPIYEYIFNGTTHRMAITVGDNGFIVGANPTSLP